MLVGEQALDSAVSPDGTRAYVPDYLNGSVTVVSIVPGQNTAPPQATTTVGVITNHTTGAVPVTVTVSDPDGNPVSITVDQPARGAVTVTDNHNGTFTLAYTPNDQARHAASATNAALADKFETLTFTLSDGKRLTSGSVAVPIDPKNLKPTDGVVTVTGTGSNGVIFGQVSVTDLDDPSQTFSGSATTPKGSVVVNPDGTFSFAPTPQARHDAASDNAAATGADKGTFSVTVDDGHGGVISVPVTVTISGTNAYPTSAVAVANAGSGPNGEISGRIVATDPDDTAPTVTAGTIATNKGGTLVIKADGTFVYTPTAQARHNASADNAAATGANQDSATVTVNDLHGGVTSFSVSVAVIGRNALPGNGTAAVGTPDAGTGKVTGTASATDPDNDPVTFGGTGTTPKGSVVVNSNGTFVYTPSDVARHAASATNAPLTDTRDSFTVTVNDGHGGTSAFQVTVTIGGKNAAATTGTATVGTPVTSNGQVTGTATVVDPDGDAVSYSGSGSTPKGTVTVNANGTFTYVPNDQVRHAASATNGPLADKQDTFTVTALDGHGGVTTFQVTVPIGGRNAIPTNGTSTVGQPAIQTGFVTGTAGAVDSDGDTLTYTGTAGSKGQVFVNLTTGAWRYEPSLAALAAASTANATAASKVDSFTIIANDGHGDSVSIPVTVTIGTDNMVVARFPSTLADQALAIATARTANASTWCIRTTRWASSTPRRTKQHPPGWISNRRGRAPHRSQDPKSW